MRLSQLGILLTPTRKALAAEGRPLRERIEGLGIPLMWGAVPPDILNDVKAWQQKCARAGLSQAPVFTKFGDDVNHISSTEVLLVVDEILSALDPPGSMGG